MAAPWRSREWQRKARGLRAFGNTTWPQTALPVTPLMPAITVPPRSVSDFHVSLISKLQGFFILSLVYCFCRGYNDPTGFISFSSGCLLQGLAHSRWFLRDFRMNECDCLSPACASCSPWALPSAPGWKARGAGCHSAQAAPQGPHPHPKHRWDSKCENLVFACGLAENYLGNLGEGGPHT